MKRRTLKRSELPAFKMWLARTGWNIWQPLCIGELLRAVLPSRRHPLVIMNTKTSVLRLHPRDEKVILAFFRQQKKEGNDGEGSIKDQ